MAAPIGKVFSLDDPAADHAVNELYKQVQMLQVKPDRIDVNELKQLLVLLMKDLLWSFEKEVSLRKGLVFQNTYAWIVAGAAPVSRISDCMYAEANWTFSGFGTNNTDYKQFTVYGAEPGDLVLVGGQIMRHVQFTGHVPSSNLVEVFAVNHGGTTYNETRAFKVLVFKAEEVT